MNYKAFFKKRLLRRSLQYLCSLVALSSVTLQASKLHAEPSLHAMNLVGITGKVLGPDGKPIAGATVMVKGSKAGVKTDEQGAFNINVPQGNSMLVISYVGFKVQEVNVAGQSTVTVILESLEALDEVVVIGYGTQRAKDITGSIVSVDMKKMEDIPVASVSEALRGQVPGLNVTGGSTRPGAMASLSIRQQFNWGKDGGTETPLIIIDDVIQVDPQNGQSTLERFNMLDQSEIESITVLRDASAAIYGARASQGAIVVKTKRGQAGAPRISYSAKFQTNDAVSHGKVMNARQYGEFANSFGRALGWNDNFYYSDTELTRMDSLNYDWLANDWRAASAMQHSLNVSGGSEKATYFTGASFYTQSPNLGRQDFDRWTFRAGSEVKVASNLKLGATIAAANTSVEKSFTKININDGSYAIGGEQNDYNILLHMPKYIPWMYTINGVDQYVSPALGPNKLGNVSGNNSLSNWNYYDLLNNGSKTTDKDFNYNANFSLDYEVPYITGLSLKLNYGITQSASNTEQVMMPLLLARANNINTLGNHLYGNTTTWDPATLNKSNSRVTYDNTTSKSDQLNFFANYSRKFGNHDIGAMFSVEKTTSNWEDRYQIYDNPTRGVYNGTSISAGTLNASNSITYRTVSGTLSYLGRLSYNYKSKYLLQFVFRSDASTKFAPENYWGFFPGVSAGWVISDEEWFQENLNWMSYLKLRGSLGITGNANVKPWKWTRLYTAATDKGMAFGSNGGQYTIGITPDADPNRLLSWDRTVQRNLGLDMSFLKSQLSVTLDGYYNTTSDMLTDMSGAIDVPISVGGAFAEQNYAGIKTWGGEIAVTWKSNVNELKYSVGMNFGIGNYKTTRYFDQPFDYPSEMTTRRAVGNTGVNNPIWGYRTWKQTSGGDGMLRTDEDIDKYWAYLSENAASSGVDGAMPSFLGITDKSQMKKGMLVYEDVRGALDADTKTYGRPNGMIEKGTGQDLDILKKSDLTYGITTNLNAEWKGISLQAQISTSWGGANYIDYIKQGTSSTHSLWSQPIYLTDMYDADTNPNGAYPNLAYYDQFGGVNSDFFLLPTFRMFVRSLSVGYSLPKAWVTKAKVQNARVFISGNNLWDFYNPYPNKYRNMYDNPQTGYPTLRTWSLGVNLGL
ncbi:SusC/RagA family TonB-linked outer membrane protein [Sphingobacterium sp. LRF_L2]|uniref:SusC/RagA family TonB-linked outer membrane protein n=1 Tax=Sphingobacterium sp. LRF_L2 TaxID=3369421 RepID=UPI003F61A0D5